MSCGQAHSWARELVAQGKEVKLVAETLAISRSSLYYQAQPRGSRADRSQEWLVVKIAECMWRLRRATRCESGSVREAAIWNGHRENDQLIAGLANKLRALEDAAKQLRESG